MGKKKSTCTPKEYIAVAYYSEEVMYLGKDLDKAKEVIEEALNEDENAELSDFGIFEGTPLRLSSEVAHMVYATRIDE